MCWREILVLHNEVISTVQNMTTAVGKLPALYYRIQIYKPDKADMRILVELTGNDKFTLKSGYSVKGDIILEKLRIYQFILKKLFRKFEDQPDA